MSQNDGILFEKEEESFKNIEQIKRQISERLQSLYQKILEEKTLGSQITVNILPKSYKKTVLSFVEDVNKISEKLILSKTYSDITSINSELKSLEKKIRIKLNRAFVETTEILEKTHNNIRLDTLRLKIKKIIQASIINKYKIEKEHINIITIPQDFKERLKKAVAIRQKEIQHLNDINLFEKELLFVTNCLIQGDTELLLNNEFFRIHPHLLKKYYPEGHALSENAFRIFVKVNIRKTLKSINFEENRFYVYEKMIQYIQTLVSEKNDPRVYKISPNHIANQIRNIQNRKC